MNMKKKLLLLLILVIGIFTLVGCGNRNSDEKNDKATPTAKEKKNDLSNKKNNNSSEDKQSESIYKRAQSLEEDGSYTLAIEEYEKILDYKDSREKYNSILSRLQKYNGTYYGESEQYKGIFYYIYINNGNVRMIMEGDEDYIYSYKLFKYGESKETGEEILAFTYTGNVSAGKSNGYGIVKQKTDNTYALIATEGSTYTTFNGFYTKTSDTVSDMSIFDK